MSGFTIKGQYSVFRPKSLLEGLEWDSNSADKGAC